MIQILTRNEIDREAWLQLLEVSPNASFFQSPGCLELYGQVDIFEPFLMGVANQGRLKGVVLGYIIADGGKLKKWLSRRAIVPGGALLAPDCSDDEISFLVHKLKKELKNKVAYVEFRNYTSYEKYKEAFALTGFNYTQHLNFHVHTNTLEEAIQAVHATKRRDVRQSLTLGAEYATTTLCSDVCEFYMILQDLYKTKVKVPLFPVEFFVRLIENNLATLIAVKFQDKVIGGSLLVELPGRVMYEWFVCGMDGRWKNIYPSTLATYGAIEYTVKQGCKYFDMMGAGSPYEAYGVRDFKSRFGGEMVEHGRFKWIAKPLLYKIGCWGVNMLKKF